MHFVEPEVVDEPEVDDANVEDIDIEAIDGADVEQDATNVVSMGAAEDDVILGDPEQLNLF